MTRGTSHSQNAPDLKLQLLSQARLLSSTRAMVSTISHRLGFSEAQSGQITLAVDEALCNIINHGYERRTDGTIWMSIWADEGERPTLKIVLEDQARQVDPKTIRSRNLEEVRPGGLGVFIIQEIMDEVSYEQRPEGGMRLTMLKRLTHDAKSKNESRKHDDASGHDCHCAENTKSNDLPPTIGYTRMSMGENETFEVEVKRSEGVTIIRPMGEIDLSHSPTLRVHLREAYKSKPLRLIIDLGAVPYMDSSGVAILVEAMKNTNTNGGKLILCDLQVKVRSIFEIARLDTVFVIAKDHDEAMNK